MRKIQVQRTGSDPIRYSYSLMEGDKVLKTFGSEQSGFTECMNVFREEWLRPDMQPEGKQPLAHQGQQMQRIEQRIAKTLEKNQGPSI